MHVCQRKLPLEEWQRLRTRIFWCYEGCPPTVDGPTRYRTANYSAWLVKSGAGELRCRGQVCRLRAGDWAVVPPPGHERHFTEGVEVLSVHFRLAWLEESDLFTLSQPVVFPARRHPALERAVRRLRRFFDAVGAQGQFEGITQPLTLAQYLQFQTLGSRFTLALTHALDGENLLPASCCTPPNPQLGQILTQLHRKPLDHPWNTAAAATALGMSAGHFNRLFREEYGQTPRQYFDTRRLEHAKNGVAAGRESIKEVAAGLGFSSAVFCRWFRQAVGASPTLYRQNIERRRDAAVASGL